MFRNFVLAITLCMSVQACSSPMFGVSSAARTADAAPLPTANGAASAPVVVAVATNRFDSLAKPGFPGAPTIPAALAQSLDDMGARAAALFGKTGVAGNGGTSTATHEGRGPR